MNKFGAFNVEYLGVFLASSMLPSMIIIKNEKEEQINYKFFYKFSNNDIHNDLKKKKKCSNYQFSPLVHCKNIHFFQGFRFL